MYSDSGVGMPPALPTGTTSTTSPPLRTPLSPQGSRPETCVCTASSCLPSSRMFPQACLPPLSPSLGSPACRLQAFRPPASPLPDYSPPSPPL
ncbi:hypothetical protein BB558_006129 [Smittium angustum]|uniref:Uncharacterized protein n=1 Tax=Smittium angustum TaxID=133377 RepID=A0A2U1IYL1_SMIAN|nr:hypothetical protein BB558_006129 [Smittium angustum]